MPVPVVNAFINFSTGPAFAPTLLLDSGILDTDVLGDSAAIIVDVSNVVNNITTQRGRNAQADQFQTGSCSLRIVDQLGNFNPQNVNSPYFSYLTPMKKVQITATYNSVTYPIFMGYIVSYSTTTPLNASDVVYTTLECVDAFRLAQNAQIATVAGTSAGQLSGARINNLLDAISWPNSMRDVDAGLTTMASDPGSARTCLAAMQTIETSEFGALYVGPQGNFVFQDRNLTATSITGTPVLFNDNGTDISYTNAVWILNDVLIYNQANVTRSGGSVQTATDQASIDKYFLHSYNQQNLLMQTDAVALDYAQAYVASRAETTVRCDSITLDLYTDNYNTGIIAALDLDFFDPVTITTNQPGNSVLTKTLQVFGKAMTITPNSWKVNMITLEAIIDSFILDNALYGTLDTTNNVLSY